MQNDPLWRMRHALAGVALAVLLSVPVAAWLANLAEALLEPALGAPADAASAYHRRVALYAAMLVYVVAGAAWLFMRVARHETRPLSAARMLRWLASLWLWPLLLLTGRRRAAAAGEREANGPP